MKKGKAKRAKLLTYLFTLLVVIVSYFIYQYNNGSITLTGDETVAVVKTHYIFFML